MYEIFKTQFTTDILELNYVSDVISTLNLFLWVDNDKTGTLCKVRFI